MVDGIGPTNRSLLDATRLAGTRTPQATRTSAIAQGAAARAVPNPAADLAAYGPTVDLGRIEAIKDAIAAGTYKIDSRAIADKMVELDLPKPEPKKG